MVDRRNDRPSGSKSVMDQAEYYRQIEAAYQGEVYGEALYQGLAEAFDLRADGRKWLTLVELETVMKGVMGDVVARIGGVRAEDPYWRQRGGEDVARYRGLS